MEINININLPPEAAAVEKASSLKSMTDEPRFGRGPDGVRNLAAMHEELVAQMGDDIKPFPKARVGGYMSHFRITIELTASPLSGRVISIVSPMAAQSVAWSDPFIYGGKAEGHRVSLPVPSTSSLPRVISDSDFLNRPNNFFQEGKETLWLQILNLDARMDSEIGPIRIILGETLLREHPDIFRPSLGAAQSLGKSGFPARLFFNPYALVETPLGAFRAIHGTLTYGRVTGFPPIGTPVSICDCVPLEIHSTVKEAMLAKDMSRVQHAGRIVALSHPIDMELQLPGEEAYHFVERLIAGGKDSDMSEEEVE